MPGKYASSYNARQLFEDWLKRDLIQKDQQEHLERFAIDRAAGRELPLYMHALVGVGAIIAGAFFVGFLGAAQLIHFDSEGGLIVWGLIFVGFAILLRAVAREGNDNTITSSFLTQASFCLMATGKVLFTIGFAQLFTSKEGYTANEGWGASLALLMLTAATYHVFPMSIDRFLSALATFVSIFFNLVSEHSAPGAVPIAINAFFAAQLGLAAFLITSGRITKDYLPIAYAAIGALCAVAIFFAMRSEIGRYGYRQDFSPAIINILLTVALIALIGWAAGGIEKLKSEPLSVAAAGALCLGVISTPGILLAVGLMILGYAQHDRVALILGGLLLPLFLWLYYYNLDLTLVAKSGILVASGAVLLAGSVYMRYRGFDRGM
jgi:hypothetical protein